MAEMSPEAALAARIEDGERHGDDVTDLIALRTHLQALQARCEALYRIADVASELYEHAQHHPHCSREANGIDGDCWCGLNGTNERYNAAIDSARKESEG